MTTPSANSTGLFPPPVARPWKPRRTYQTCYYSLSGFLIFSTLGAGEPPAPRIDRPAAPRPLGPAVVSDNAASPLDEPLRLIGEARTVFQKVKDYSCVLIKRERINGQLTPDHVVALKVRNEPFSVYMRWMQPKDLSGQEVCYVAPKHGNRMRAHSAGALGLVGWVTLDQNDPRALKTSRHRISEAGLANLIDRYSAGWQAERPLGRTQVSIADYEYNKRRCTRVETAHSADSAGQFEYFRTVVYFDQETHLPIRVECYDYPRRANETGELVEVYSYVNLRYNVGLDETTFNH